MNVAIDHHDMSINAMGILGETLVPTVNANGSPIMQGISAIRGTQEDCEYANNLKFAKITFLFPHDKCWNVTFTRAYSIYLRSRSYVNQ